MKSESQSSCRRLLAIATLSYTICQASDRQTAAGLLVATDIRSLLPENWGGRYRQLGAHAAGVEKPHPAEPSDRGDGGGREGRAREFTERRIAQRRLTVVQTIGSYQDETRCAVHTDVRTRA